MLNEVIYVQRSTRVPPLVDKILAWHDAETRALREALREIIAFSPQTFGDPRLGYVGIRVSRVAVEDAKKLLTPTPGAGKEVECYCNSHRHYPSQHPVTGCLVVDCCSWP